jgi:hypothetical protein
MCSDVPHKKKPAHIKIIRKDMAVKRTYFETQSKAHTEANNCPSISPFTFHAALHSKREPATTNIYTFDYAEYIQVGG